MNKPVALEEKPPVCDYEGSDYQTRFWDHGGREYEDGCEAIALKRLLPKAGDLLLEIGAGAGRNTLRYSGFKRIVLMDYSQTQLKQAKERLGNDERFIYVVADVYRLPFIDSLFDAATMIRVLHHMSDAPLALKQIQQILKPSAWFILEYANKRNIKSILRFFLGKQKWNPFSTSPVEFSPLNFDFHPNSIRNWLTDLDLIIKRILTVSHFRIGWIKRNIPTSLLIFVDSILQWTGRFFQLSPSVFLSAQLAGVMQSNESGLELISCFKCPRCSGTALVKKPNHLQCSLCGANWPIEDGIFIFKE